MLSIVVNFFNNRREAMNTLYSLTRKYQRDVQDLDYEVIAIDNNSAAPLTALEVQAFGPQFRHRFVRTDSMSPAASINQACRDAQGERLLVIIDGAHILSPGVLGLTHAAFEQFDAPFIATVPMHLGPKQQNQAVLEGYNQGVEDALLARCAWKADGYRLFGAAGSFADGSLGWFGCLFESGCFGLRKTDYLQMGGLDERFASRGGGFVNLDFFQRALIREQQPYVMLLGEATFHQFHGGVASNAPANERPWDEFHAEYQRLRGQAFRRIARRPFFLGTLPTQALGAARISAQLGLEQWQNAHAAGQA